MRDACSLSSSLWPAFRGRKAGAVLAAFLSLIAASAAASPGDPVGNPIEVSASSANAYPIFPSVARNADGSFVAVWLESTRKSYGAVYTSSVLGRRYTAAGLPIGDAFAVSQTPLLFPSKGPQPNYPAVAMAPNGQFVVVWLSLGLPTSIHGRRFAADGTPQGAEFAVLRSEDAGNEIAPTVAMAPDGSFALATIASNSIAAPEGESLIPVYEKDRLYLRRFNAKGQITGLPILVDSRTFLIGPNVVDGSVGNPALAIDAQGRMLVAWTHSGNVSAGLVARRYSASGSALGPVFDVSPSVQATDVGFDASGRFVIAWSAEDGIHTRRFDASGTSLEATFTASYALAPKIAVAPSGQFAVMWDASSQVGVLFRVFDASGAPLTAAAQALPAFAGVPANIMSLAESPFFDIACDAGGDFITAMVVDSLVTGYGANNGLYAQRFSGN